MSKPLTCVLVVLASLVFIFGAHCLAQLYCSWTFMRLVQPGVVHIEAREAALNERIGALEKMLGGAVVHPEIPPNK